MSQDVRQLLMTFRVLWIAISSSTVLFLIVMLVVPGHAGRPEPLLTLLLGAVALGCAAASFVVPRVTLRAALGSLTLQTREEEDPDGLPGFGRKLHVAADPARATLSALRAAQPSFILSLALSEAVSLFGFVLGFMGASPVESLPFFVVTWLLLSFRFPRLEPVLSALEQSKGIRVPRAVHQV